MDGLLKVDRRGKQSHAIAEFIILLWRLSKVQALGMARLFGACTTKVLKFYKYFDTTIFS